MIAAINYGWTGIFGFCVLLLVTKFHRPFEVRLWTWHMKKAGVSQRDIKELWKREVTKNGQDFLIQLTETSRKTTPKREPEPQPEPTLKPDPAPQPSPRKRTPGTRTNCTPANPTTPAKATSSTPKPQTRPKRQPTVLPEPEQTRGRHAKPDEDPGSAAETNDGKHYRP